MPFVSSRDIALNVRRQAEKDYRAQLRQALANPALTLLQRADITRRLGQVGGQRVYDASTPPPPGAISFTSPPPDSPGFTENELQVKKKAELVMLAWMWGLPKSGTKAKLVERLLAR